jgi:hypothetical protein
VRGGARVHDPIAAADVGAGGRVPAVGPRPAQGPNPPAGEARRASGNRRPAREPKAQQIAPGEPTDGGRASRGWWAWHGHGVGVHDPGPRVEAAAPW